MQLTEQQAAAVNHIGTPALVIAGAGSGKTRTLTAKIAYLVKSGYDPKRILAITFTNKAAGEMKSRLIEMTRMSPEAYPWVRTYHSACYQILRGHCHLLGYEPPIQIYSDYQQQKTMAEIAADLNIEKKFVSRLLGHISSAKNSGDPDAYFDKTPNMAHIRLTDIHARYEAELRARNVVDFDNILFLTRNLLRDHEAVRENYRRFFQYILVDEYQDSNNLQEELTRLLLGNGNLFCVGDDWQAIYGFRGSNVSHFLTFKNTYQGATVFKLEENFRSSDEIVQVANDLIGFNDQRTEKHCFSNKGGGLVEHHDFFDENDEARWVCRKIDALRELGVPYKQMAILYRTRFCSLAFEKGLRYFRIPYRMMGSKGFFERKEILDINCYLAAAAFPKDDVAFDRIVNIPKRGIGPVMMKKIGDVRVAGMSLQDAARKVLVERILAPKVHQALTHLIKLLDDIRPCKPDEAIGRIIESCGYLDYLKHYTKTEADYTARVENIDELVYTASKKDTINDYLEEAALIREDREEDEQADGQGVNLSTVHASKGLEYHSVFITGCEEDLFPHWKSKETDEELQEERRLMYVAITRAEQYLFLSRAAYRRGQAARKSRFLYEIEESLSE